MRVARIAEKRKNLLPRLEASLIALRKRRNRWNQTDPVQRGGSSDMQALFQFVQNLLMQVLLLDRENQQALLRRGLCPRVLCLQHRAAASLAGRCLSAPLSFVSYAHRKSDRP
jgi:hypothetical protein